MKKENIDKIYIPQSEGIPDINSYEGLNKHYLKVSESLSEIHKKEEEEAQNQHKQILELAGRKNITKEEGKTVVCDGASLHCPFSGFTGEGHDGFIFQAPRNMKTITLKVKREKGKLMGKDSIATIGDCLGENFEPIPELMCQITGEKCKIKQVGGNWSKYSSSLIVYGKNAILKESVLKCNIESILPFCPAETPLLIVEDNGQNSEIKHALFGSMFSPTDRKFLKGVAVIVIVVFVTRGVGLAAAKEGGLIYLYEQGYYATGSAAEGILYTEAKTGLMSSAFTSTEYLKSYLETTKSGTVIVQTLKGVVGEPGKKIYNHTKESLDIVPYVYITSLGIHEGRMIFRNKKITEELVENNIELKSLEKQMEGGYRIPEKEFRNFDLTKRNESLNSQKYTNYQLLDTIKDTGKDNIKGKITDSSVEKIVTSETSDWTTHRSQIEYSKQPFLTDIEIKGVK